MRKVVIKEFKVAFGQINVGLIDLDDFEDAPNESLRCYLDMERICGPSCVAAIIEDCTFTCVSLGLKMHIIKPKKKKTHE